MVSSTLIKSCSKKDRKACKTVYELAIPYVYSVVKRYISNTEDRKDLVQETFAKIFLNLHTFDAEKGKFKIWIRKITVNECLMHLRKSVNLTMYNLDDQYDASDPNSTAILDNLTRDDIINLLEKMPSRYKAVFLAYIIDGYNHTEIGEMLNITKDTSRSQLSRAKQWVIKNITHTNKKKLYGLF